MPDDILRTLKKNMKKEWIIAFFSTFVSGLFIHLYRFTNFLPNWDSLMDYYYPINNMTHQGRHLQVVSCAASGFSDVPWVIGILCLLYLSITVVLLTDLFQIKKPLPLILFSVVMASFPTFTSCFAFMYMADAFFAALLLAVLAVFLTIRTKWGFLFGAVLLTFSMGTYQAYVAFAIALILLWIVFKLLFTETSVKEVLRSCFKLLIMGIGSAVLYVVSLQLLSSLEQIAVSGHQGMGSMSIPTLSRIVDAFIGSYVDTAYFFIGSIRHLSFWGICNIVLILSGIFLFVSEIIRKKLYQKVPAFLLILLCLILFPAVSHIFYFLTPDVSYHLLMQGSLVLVYLLIILLYAESKSSRKPVYWAVFLSLSVLCYSSAVTANTNYTALTRSYQKSYAIMNRMVDRMEQLADYADADSIAVLGAFDDSDKISLGGTPEIVGYTDSYFFSHQKHIVAMLNEYYNIKLEGVTEDMLTEIAQSDAAAQMKPWPDKSSVIQIDKTIIVKLGEYQND